jgi:hypothetical protein
MSCCILGPGGAITETGDRAYQHLQEMAKDRQVAHMAL